jgi:1-acyl-sn-glycerol-3-phosphate acyltransferase
MSSAHFDADRLDGRDEDLLRRLLPWIRRFNRHYIRLRVEGADNLLGGPALYVGNHNNGLAGPDVLATLGTLWDRFGVEAPIYGLAHDWAMCQLTPFGRLIQRFGAVRASRANARRLLEQGGVALVYPGGVKDAFRPTRRAGRIDFDGRLGFVRVARESGAPIVPVVAEGAHRSAFIWSDGEGLARSMGLERIRQDRFPIALALPWGLTLGPWLPYLPLPFRVTIRFLPAVRVGERDDVHSVQASVASSMQAALDEMSREAT